MNNRREFIKKSFLAGILGCFAPGLIKANLISLPKRIILYGYNWQYDSSGYNGFGECNYYPNKLNREEYVYYPPNPITSEIDKWHGIKYDHSHGIKTIRPCFQGSYYYKNGKKFNIVSEISGHVGWSDICCEKTEFCII